MLAMEWGNVVAVYAGLGGEVVGDLSMGWALWCCWVVAG